MLTAGQTLAHFEVLEQLGAGGMGVVYKARDVQLNRLIALKVLPPATAGDAAMRSRLLREARSASALNHANIVTIHEAGSADGVDFIAMEYVEGTTLATRIPPGGMTVTDTISIGSAIAAALAAAHAAGIVHRDLKPANVMVRADGTVKVMDFGLATVVLSAASSVDSTRTLGATVAGTVSGTVPYMSPEQAEAKQVDARSDIFSFGAVLYEMLTGHRAFQGDTLISTISSVLKDTPPPIGNIRQDAGGGLTDIVGRCLQKNPEDRYATGTELQAALAAIATRTPASLARRANWIAIAAAILVFAGAGSWWGVKQWHARWVYNYAIPEMDRLQAEQEYVAVFRLARQARQILPADPTLERAIGNLVPTIRFASQPPGASVYFRPYLEPSAPEQFLGETPAGLRIPVALTRVHLVKNGYEDVEGTVEPSSSVLFLLDPKGTRPLNMVTVPPGTQGAGRPHVQPALVLARQVRGHQSGFQSVCRSRRLP